MALARVWRPQKFEELIGQDAIKTAIVNALNKNRLHHAYLFTGTRGVGKTTIARLFAKALNCEQGISATPCLQCRACKDVADGAYIDLIEIDGASKTKVEDTREVLENLNYSPVAGRFKIYLIDEVHMLSQHSFNALLKTLEEPPEHVKFLLATTDPQKLPLTILSRCLNFHLKPLSDEVIQQQLNKILISEKITYDENAVILLSQAAKGSMRDALSLLDQVIAFIDNHLSSNDVRALLGYTSQDYAITIIEALAKIDKNELMAISKNVALEGGSYAYVMEELIQYLHKIAVAQILNFNPQAESLINLAQQAQTLEEKINYLSQLFSPEEIQLLYEIALKGLEQLYIAPTRRIGFEMTLLRMFLFKPINLENLNDDSYLKAPEKSAFVAQVTSKVKPQENITPTQNKEATGIQDIVKSPVDAPSAPSVSETSMPQTNESSNLLNLDEWKKIIPEFKLSGLAQNIIGNSKLIAKDGNIITLQINNNQHSLLTPQIIQRIADGMSNYFQEKISLTIKEPDIKKISAVKDKTQSFTKDPFFQQLQQEFSAAIVKNSITLNDEDEL